MGIKNKKGFSFIELIVVIGVISIALPVLFSIIIVIIQQQLKINALSEVKRQGDFALNAISTSIKNYATEIYSDSGGVTEICIDPESPQNLTVGSFEDKFTNRFFYTLSSDQIASTSVLVSGTTTSKLTSSKVKVEDLTITCSKKALYAAPVVSLSFNVSYRSTALQSDKTALKYQTKIKLRNY